MGYQQNRSSSISTFHDYNQQNNEYDDGDSGWKGFGGNDDKSNSREEGVRAQGLNRRGAVRSAQTKTWL